MVKYALICITYMYPLKADLGEKKKRKVKEGKKVKHSVFCKSCISFRQGEANLLFFSSIIYFFVLIKNNHI